MYRDPYTGHYLTHYRVYDPHTARWLTHDPAGFQDGLNLYAAYMGVNGVDPLGLWKWDGDWVEHGLGGWLGIHGKEVQQAGNEGFRGGASITTDTLTFGLSDKVGLTDASQYQGGYYTGTRILSTIGRELLLTASGGKALQVLGFAGKGGKAFAAVSFAKSMTGGAIGAASYAAATVVNPSAEFSTGGFIGSFAGGAAAANVMYRPWLAGALGSNVYSVIQQSIDKRGKIDRIEQGLDVAIGAIASSINISKRAPRNRTWRKLLLKYKRTGNEVYIDTAKNIQYRQTMIRTYNIYAAPFIVGSGSEFVDYFLGEK
jgi:hypothetical protein